MTDTCQATVVFVGERHQVNPAVEFVVGRGGDLDIDDNPWLHRRFLTITWDAGMWWLSNTGDVLAATVSDPQGLLQTWMGPGARVPLVLSLTTVMFTAGPTTYDLEVHLSDPPYQKAPALTPESTAHATPGADTTIRPPELTPSQRALIVSLAEPVLLGRGGVGSSIPSNADAAKRLDWPLTRFNRKLDNVCDRLSTSGVRGLRGGPDRLASQRRARLVEYALAARLVSAADLHLLEPGALE